MVPKWKKLFILTMASFLSISVLTLFLFITISSTAASRHSQSQPFSSSASSEIIHQACYATRFPQPCQSSLHDLPSSNPSDIITSAISVSTQNLKTAKSMVEEILSSSTGNLNRTNAAKNCIEVLTNSDRRISSVQSVAIPQGKIKDGRARMSAALAYQYDCWSGLKYVNETSKVNETMSFLAGLIQHTSNALSILVAHDVYGNDTASWKPPRTERDGFWEPVSGSGSSPVPEFPAGLKADVTVCKNQGCDYQKIQDAVDSAPENSNSKFVIGIKEGVYDEIVRVSIEKRNIVFVGDGMGKTVITGDQHVGIPGVSTYNSATLGVLGDGFIMSGVTVQNTAGPDAHQAVAFRSDSDLSLIHNCELIGNQDTLYAHSLRQLYNKCRIIGNVDFIFGNSASIFQDCTILIQPRQLNPEKGENNAVTAHGRTDPAQSTGFVFQNCVINGTEEYLKFYKSNPKVHKNYLGRPWKEYSRTVFINCAMEGIVTGDGWMPWSGDFALQTLFYGEYGNTGAGADLSGRVKWSSEIPEEHVAAYSPDNFIQGTELVET
uniref:pectinesterase n=1 Tax=Kalanchoe fedtschenkoi TaxID=63787 RepID=A0A7N1A5T1_KALFE